MSGTPVPYAGINAIKLPVTKGLRRGRKSCHFKVQHTGPLNEGGKKRKEKTSRNILVMLGSVNESPA